MKKILSIMLMILISSAVTGCNNSPAAYNNKHAGDKYSDSYDSGDMSEIQDTSLDPGIELLVPDFRGKSFETLERDEQYKGYFIFREKAREWSDTVPEGRIIDQDPAPGMKVGTRNYPIYLTVSSGAYYESRTSSGYNSYSGYSDSGDYVQVPDVKGLSAQEAEKILKKAGLKVDIIYNVFTFEPEGTIIYQYDDGKMRKGDTVTLEASNGRFRVRYIKYTFEVPDMFRESSECEYLDIDIYTIDDASGDADRFLIKLEDVSYESVKNGINVTFDAAYFEPFEGYEYQHWRYYINGKLIHSGRVNYYDGGIIIDW